MLRRILLLVFKYGQSHVQRRLQVFSLIASHTHGDIDVSFGHWSMKLCKEDFLPIPLLRKSYYMNLDLNVMVVPHLFEEASNFKAFINLCILKGVGYRGSTIMLLYVGMMKVTDHAIQALMHIMKLGAKGQYTCMMLRWQMNFELCICHFLGSLT